MTTITKNFLLAFGGTGARCAEAVAYLAAARVLRSPTYVLVVDPDETNGNTTLATKQLGRYHQLHTYLAATDDSAPFFSTPLNIRAGDIGAREGGESFMWKYGSDDRQWKDIIDYSPDTSAPGNGLYELLYDDSDMQMSFGEGYVGRAHIGALDIYLTFDRAAAAETPDSNDRPLIAFLEALEAASKGGGANLAVAGSIFGGTGASGLPAVPPFLRKYRGLRDQQSNIRLAAIQLAPYFSFRVSDDAEMPDSSLHPVTTQSSLFHYGTTPVGYDRVYLVGSPEQHETNAGEPVRGGPGQQNRAHYAELAAGLAVEHFFRAPPAERSGENAAPPVFASYSGSTGYAGFPGAEETDLRAQLVTFATACALHAVFLAPAQDALRGYEFMNVMRKQTGGVIEKGHKGFDALTAFSTRFLDWMVEVNERPQQLLTAKFARGVETFLKEPTEYYRGAADSFLAEIAPDFLPGNGRDTYQVLVEEYMNRMTEPLGQGDPMGFYIALLTKAAEKFCAAGYKNW
jgi:hypothetical protein